MLEAILAILLPLLKEVFSDVLKDWMATPDYRVKDVAPSPLPDGACGPLPGADDLLDRYGGVLAED